LNKKQLKRWYEYNSMMNNLVSKSLKSGTFEKTNINTNTNTMRKVKRNQGKDNIISIYSKSFLTRTIMLPITAINDSLAETIEKTLKFNYEGKCVEEGFVKPDSINIITFSSGIIERGNMVSFCVVFECQVCFPVEGTNIVCKAKSITKAGIHAESANENPNPVTVFVANDHNYMNPYYAEVKEGDTINVRIIGQMFQLNDKYISVIGELIRPKLDFKSIKK